MRVTRRWRAFALCLLLAILHTWPLALHPSRLSLNANADAELNEWIMAWVAHQLPRDPGHLFEANIFYPAHDALAFSEPLIVPALIGAPLAWLGASPVLVYNLVLIAGFALTAFAAYALVERWTGSMAAGLLAGSVFAFNTHTLHRLPHMQGIHIYALPIALLALDGLVTTGSYRAAALLVAALVLAAYTSGYLIVFVAFCIAIVLAVRAPEWAPRARMTLPPLAAAAAIGTLAILPIYIPYHRVAVEQHMVRSLEATQEYSATPVGYLATTSRMHYPWSRAIFHDPVDSFFPGFVVLTLAVLAMARRRAAGDLERRRIWMLVALAIAGFVLSLGTATPVYGWLFHVFPPMQGLRAAARFGNLFLLGIAALGGIGLARIKRTWIAAALVALANLEALRAPMTYSPFHGIPELYSMLAHEPGPVVLVEQPFFPRWAIFQNGGYVLASTAHWRPLMNGYSGYTPDTYQQYADSFWYFPQEHAIAAMKAAGVTHVMVHPSAYERDHQAVLPVLDTRTDFELMGIGPGGLRLYRLKR